MSQPENDPRANEPARTVADMVTDARKPAYDAVYDYIRSLPPTSDAVVRNARIWNAVHAALDAMDVGRCVSSHCVDGDHTLALDDTEPA